jgi:hypothetical protein
MITAVMGLRGTNRLVAFLVVLAVALIVLFCVIVLSTQPSRV